VAAIPATFLSPITLADEPDRIALKILSTEEEAAGKEGCDQISYDDNYSVDEFNDREEAGVSGAHNDENHSTMEDLHQLPENAIVTPAVDR